MKTTIKMSALQQWLLLSILWVAGGLPSHAIDLPDRMTCTAEQTAGFHDYPHNAEAYEAVIFYESAFSLSMNKALNAHLTEFDVYLMLEDDAHVAELQCRLVRGLRDSRGLSCSNVPPSDLLLLNLDSLRFTRTAIGGWTFSGAHESSAGESIFVEYGYCSAD